jgi:hypothetical protein
MDKGTNIWPDRRYLHIFNSHLSNRNYLSFNNPKFCVIRLRVKKIFVLITIKTIFGSNSFRSKWRFDDSKSLPFVFQHHTKQSLTKSFKKILNKRKVSSSPNCLCLSAHTFVLLSVFLSFSLSICLSVSQMCVTSLSFCLSLY